jgi:hypothetical protein
MNPKEYKWVALTACVGLLFALIIYIVDAVSK